MTELTPDMQATVDRFIDEFRQYVLKAITQEGVVSLNLTIMGEKETIRLELGKAPIARDNRHDRAQWI